MYESKPSLFIPEVDLLLGTSFVQVSKHLIKTFGLVESVIISNLIEKNRYFVEHHKIEDRWFFQKMESQATELNISLHILRKGISKLQDEGVLIVEKRGVPAKYWYYIDDVRMVELVKLKSLKFLNSSDQNFKTLYKNTKDKKKKEKDFGSPAAQDERDGSVSDKKSIQLKIADRVIQTLNKMTRKRYQNTQANRKFILARLNEGYVLKDFIQVVRTKKQDPYFISNPKFMRPETLFGTKFDTYLNESPEEYSEEIASTSNGAALPPVNPYSAATTKPYEEFLEDPTPANLTKLYRNLQSIEKWVQGIDYDHYKKHTVLTHNYPRWQNFAERMVRWINEDQTWISKHPSVFEVGGKIWKQFYKDVILGDIFNSDNIKMKWDKY